MASNDGSADSLPKGYFDDLKRLNSIRQNSFPDARARQNAIDQVIPRPDVKGDNSAESSYIPVRSSTLPAVSSEQIHKAGEDLDTELAALKKSEMEKVLRDKDYRIHAAENPETNNFYITPPDKSSLPDASFTPMKEAKPSLAKRVLKGVVDAVLFIPRKIAGIFRRGK